jgi:hypothetical protein
MQRGPKKKTITGENAITSTPPIVSIVCPIMRRIVNNYKQDGLLIDPLSSAQINTHHYKASMAHLYLYMNDKPS